MAASSCVEKGRRVRDWSARPASGSGRPFKGSVEAFFGESVEALRGKISKIGGHNLSLLLKSRYEM